MKRLATVTVLAVALSGCAASSLPGLGPAPGPAVVTGQVVWRERLMLPPSIAKIQLLDVSLADAPAVVLAEQTIEGVRAPPVAFRLTYDPAKIVRSHRYTVSVRIETDGKLRFISDTHNAVITNDVTDIEVMVVSAGG